VIIVPSVKFQLRKHRSLNFTGNLKSINVILLALNIVDIPLCELLIVIFLLQFDVLAFLSNFLGVPGYFIWKEAG